MFGKFYKVVKEVKKIELNFDLLGVILNLQALYLFHAATNAETFGTFLKVLLGTDETNWKNNFRFFQILPCCDWISANC